MIKQCLRCGKNLKVTPHKYAKGRGKWCSRSCFLESRKGVSTGEHVKGDACSYWKGDSAGRCGIHIWVRRNKPVPDGCEFCGRKDKRLHLANMKNHKYTRNPDDYKYLCPRCHYTFDGIIYRKNPKHKYFIELLEMNPSKGYEIIIKKIRDSFDNPKKAIEEARDLF